MSSSCWRCLSRHPDRHPLHPGLHRSLQRYFATRLRPYLASLCPGVIGAQRLLEVFARIEMSSQNDHPAFSSADEEVKLTRPFSAILMCMSNSSTGSDELSLPVSPPASEASSLVTGARGMIAPGSGWSCMYCRRTLFIADTSAGPSAEMRENMN